MKKWILYGLLGVVVILAGLYLFYYAIQGTIWNDEQAAVSKVLSQSPVTHIEKIDKFISDETYMIVQGLDGEGRKHIVWLNGEEIHAEPVDQGVTPEQLKSFMAKRYEQPHILRIMPGKLGEAFVWEVFYTVDTEGDKRYYYDYYRFHNGDYLRTYRLSRKVG